MNIFVRIYFIDYADKTKDCWIVTEIEVNSKKKILFVSLSIGLE